MWIKQQGEFNDLFLFESVLLSYIFIQPSLTDPFYHGVRKLLINKIS